ncbi:hypothetical protein CP982_00590 [Streptomyces spectabilis]|uniref:Uncharacterized protein n=2 Tax=Streptomyces spectabilis TaxID=68270 RepID=A0A5P2X298_STRST|nr:hypothetical protein CP982_00590 [Streptomyces spectabilis]
MERLEGRVTPNVCAFLQRQIRFGEMPTGPAPEPGESGFEHPRVKAYLDIFDTDATLWEAGSKARRGRDEIGPSIINSLGLVKDLRYRGTDVVAEGSTVVFGQWNEATVKGHKIAFPQIARNVLGDDGKSLQARRYYDRHVLLRDTLPDAPSGLFEGIADSGPAPAKTPASRGRADAELPRRLAAWNSEDIDTLLARTGNMRLSGPGLDAPLSTAAAKKSYLQRFFDKANVELKAGQVAVGKTTTYVEWHGTVTRPQGEPVPFGIMERFGPGGEWELYFDTLPLLADQKTIDDLFAKLARS